jgi:hypothetical protein
MAVRRSQENKGLKVFTCLSCGGADRRLKIGSLTVSVAAASQIVFSKPDGRPHITKIGGGHTRYHIKKLSPAPVIKLICGLGPQVKGFLHRWNDTFKKFSF